jgi:hypothetical protein
MPFEAYKIYEEYEPDRYKTSTQEKVAKALAGAKKEGLEPAKDTLDFGEVRELFGPDFLGIEEAEQFTGRPLTSEEKRMAEEKWQKKIEEQGLTKEALEQLKQEGFMIVLRVGTLAGKEKKDKEMPVTIKNLKKKFPLFYNQDWYKNESFADEPLSGIDWGIVKKEVLDESKSKNWDEQEEILKAWAEAHGVDEKFVRRRTPTEVAYDVLAYFKVRNERILERDWDWTSVQSSGGKFVFVGNFDSDGLGVYFVTRDSRYSFLGVCPAR